MAVFWLGGASANSEPVKGSVASMDPSTGKKAAQQTLGHAIYSGVTATAGGLVFTTTVEGTVWALDDVTLKPLWSFNTGSISSAPPMTYSVNGKQYVAVLIGGQVLARSMLDKSPDYQRPAKHLDVVRVRPLRTLAPKVGERRA